MFESSWKAVRRPLSRVSFLGHSAIRGFTDWPAAKFMGSDP